jgi:hypothetical protein
LYSIQFDFLSLSLSPSCFLFHSCLLLQAKWEIKKEKKENEIKRSVVFICYSLKSIYINNIYVNKI